MAKGRPEALVKTALEARGITKSYGERVVLNGVDLSIRDGEVVALIGPSGSGKSTFIRCLNLLTTPDAGQISVLGQPLWEKDREPSRATLRELRRNVGMVFQSFNLFPTLTVLENVSLAQVKGLGRSKSAADERSRDLLSKVGLADWAGHRPTQLSGGQQQRVAIARAMALDPKVLLLDEPTSAIDPELRVEVLQVMRDMAATGVTMVVVTHEMKFAERVADRVIFFADGSIVEQGTPLELFKSPQEARTKQFLAALNEEAL